MTESEIKQKLDTRFNPLNRGGAIQTCGFKADGVCTTLGFDPLNRGGDIQTLSLSVDHKVLTSVSILLIEAGIFRPWRFQWYMLWRV